jgi:hypothetical protein
MMMMKKKENKMMTIMMMMMMLVVVVVVLMMMKEEEHDYSLSLPHCHCPRTNSPMRVLTGIVSTFRKAQTTFGLPSLSKTRSRCS